MKDVDIERRQRKRSFIFFLVGKRSRRHEGNMGGNLGGCGWMFGWMDGHKEPIHMVK